jgi:DNA polymerase I-like protein with 3'-5' exonuclease and polymerase domains
MVAVLRPAVAEGSRQAGRSADAVDTDAARQSALHLQTDGGWLRRCGLDLSDVVVFDTKIAEYVLLGNRAAADRDTGEPGISTSLDAVAQRRGFDGKDAIVALYFKHGFTVDQIPQRWVEQRCVRDIVTTEGIFRQQRGELYGSNRLPVLYTRCLLTPVLAEIEPNGMCLSEPRVAQAHAEHTALLQKLTADMDAMTGGINWRSSKQAGEFIYGTEGLGFDELRRRGGEPIRTPNGKRKTDNKTLDKLVATTDKQREFIKLRRLLGKCSAALSKNLNYFKGVCDEQGGIFNAEFNQTVTATHRLSSSGIPSAHGTVQFQSLPRAFKPLFTARTPGWLVCEVDGSQLEFRVAAYLGQDSQAMADIADRDWDAHLTSGAAMSQRPYAELRAAYLKGERHAVHIRQEAKAETFKPLYGGSKGTPAQERWYKAFRERYPELGQVQSDWVAEVVTTKQLVTPWGLTYYWPRASVNNYGYCNVKASVYNYPVQALATAEIIPIAIRCLRDRIQRSGLGDRVVIVNTVHDSIVVEVEPTALDEFKQQAILAFTVDVYEYLEQVYHLKMNVPLGCGIKAGEFWSEGQEESYNVYADGRQERLK